MSFFGDAPAELIYSTPGIGVSATGTVTSQIISPTAATTPPCELPHNYFSRPGKAIMIEAYGIYVLGSTIPTMKMSVYLDTTIGTPSATLLGATGAFTAGTASVAAGQWYMKMYAVATAIGSSGTLQSFGLLHWGPAQLTTTTGVPDYMMGTGATTPITFATNTTAAVYPEIYASWSTTSTGPSLTLTGMLLWGLN